MTNSLGSFDPNVLPMDAFSLEGAEGDTRRVIGLKEPWMFGTAIASAKWTPGVGYAPGNVVYHDEDGLVYMNLAATSTVEPDYSDAGIEGTTWKWVAGSISGFVSGRGWWTKFADGTLIQRGYTSGHLTSSSVSNWVGSTSGVSYFADVYVTLPISFYGLINDWNEYAVSRAGAGIIRSASGAPYKTMEQCMFQVFSSSYADGADIHWLGIGRWKA